jgi:hypothetical protein
MEWKTLDRPPMLAPLYWHAVLKRKITGSHLPEQGFRCRVSVNPQHVAAYPVATPGCPAITTRSI